MKTFYVATLARYVLVDAADETEAASLGQDALHALYADLRAKHGRDIPIEIRTVHLARDAEIDLWQFHQRMLREDAVSQLKAGDRVRLARMADDPDSIPAGQRGTVVGIHLQRRTIQSKRRRLADEPRRFGSLSKVGGISVVKVSIRRRISLSRFRIHSEPLLLLSTKARRNSFSVRQQPA